MRIFIALDVKRAEGPNLSAEAVREELENELPESLDVEDSNYDITVLGMGGSEAELRESVKLRQRRGPKES